MYVYLWMKLTGLLSGMLRATWWDLYSSCLRSTWLWKRGCFLTGSSGPNCGETTLSTGVQESEKMKGLNIDLAARGKETKKENLHQPPACSREGRNESTPCNITDITTTGVSLEETQMVTSWTNRRREERGEKEVTASPKTTVSHLNCSSDIYFQVLWLARNPKFGLSITRPSVWSTATWCDYYGGQRHCDQFTAVKQTDTHQCLT